MTPKQRLDRARTCYRLWTLHQQQRQSAATIPETSDRSGQQPDPSKEATATADHGPEFDDDGPSVLPIWAEPPAGDGWRESVMIYDGFYRGRKFVASEFTGIWFIEEDELKIQNADGVPVASLDEAKMAAIIRTDEEERRADEGRRAA